MNNSTKPFVLALGIAVVASCTPRMERQPIQAEPVFNKFGSIEECVTPDRRVFQPNQEWIDPCLPPEDCPDGFISAAGEYICADDIDERDPRTPDPGDPAIPPTTGPGGFGTIGTGGG